MKAGGQCEQRTEQRDQERRRNEQNQVGIGYKLWPRATSRSVSAKTTSSVSTVKTPNIPIELTHQLRNDCWMGSITACMGACLYGDGQNSKWRLGYCAQGPFLARHTQCGFLSRAAGLSTMVASALTRRPVCAVEDQGLVGDLFKRRPVRAVRAE